MKRRSTKRRRKTATALSTRRAHSVRRANPTRRRHHVKAYRRRRHNPSELAGTSILKDGAWATLGAMLTQFLRPFVPINMGGVWGDAAVQFGISYLLGVGVSKFLKDKNAGKMVVIGGSIGALTTIANSFGLTPSALLQSAKPAAKPVAGAGMQDIVALRGGQADPYFGRTGGRPVGGMNDIVQMAPQPAY